MNKFFTKIYRKFSTLPLWKKSILSALAIFPLLLILAMASLYVAVLLGAFGRLPSSKKLLLIEHNTGSQILSIDSVVLGKYFIQDRTNVSNEELPNSLIHALIATEDARFYDHDGLDGRSMARVLFKSILSGDESSGGGSTLSQQLAKNLFPRTDHGFLSMPVNKVREIVIARRLEKTYSKDDLLTLYLNTVSFGENVFGIEAAAIRYFNTSTAELRTEQSAVLVGMLKATNSYSPRLYPERSSQRRDLVLSQMSKYGYLPEAAKDSLQEIPLKIDYTRLDQNRGQATYFREHLRGILDNWADNFVDSDGTTYDIYTDGLRIYTTIDSKMQLYAEQAMHEHMASLQQQFDRHWGSRKPWEDNPRLLELAILNSLTYSQMSQAGKDHDEIVKAMSEKKKVKVFTHAGEKEVQMTALAQVAYYLRFLNAGMMSMEPSTGAIRTWVGGINHTYFKYDHVNRRTKRQVGSTFKPLVYASAIEQGVSPCTFFSAQRERYLDYENWSPGNADDDYKGNYSMKGGLMKSINTISVKVLKEAGIDSTIALAKRLGIDSEIPKVPSIALGTPEISLMEIVAAYGAFANQGMYNEPYYLLRIEDRDGNLLADFSTERVENRRAMSASTANLTLEMLKGVVSSGTAARLRNSYGLRNDMAGKTGTTQSQADGWFVGITPDLVTGVWVGADSPGIRFRSTSLGQGSSTALPIFAKFTQKMNSDKKFLAIRVAKFPPLSEYLQSSLDCPIYREDKEAGFLISLFTKPRQEVADTYFNRETLQNSFPDQAGKDPERKVRRKEQEPKQSLGNKLKGIFEKKRK